MSEAPDDFRVTPRLVAAVVVVVAFVVVVIWGVAVLPKPTPPLEHPTTSSTSLPTTGRAAVEVVVEVPSSHGTATSSTVSGAPSPTARGATVDRALVAAGYDVVGEAPDLTPPTASQVAYLPGAGSLLQRHHADADTIAELLGLASSAVVPYHGTTVGLPSGTAVIVVVGSQA